MTTHRTWMSCALFTALLLAACGKAQEKASEAAMEKAIESEMAKSGGGQAKVDLSGGSLKMTTTDASGKTTQMEMGAAQVTEAELGLPFYPGAKQMDGGATRISTGEGSTMSVGLHSADSADKVASFYRDQLKAKAAGKQFMDMSGGDGNATLMLADDKDKSSLQVSVMKAESGSDIQIVANRRSAAH